MMIEHVGNPACPAPFSLEEHVKEAILPATEGGCGPIEDPYMFHDARFIILNRVDLTFYVGFDAPAPSKPAAGQSGHHGRDCVRAAGRACGCVYTCLRVEAATVLEATFACFGRPGPISGGTNQSGRRSRPSPVGPNMDGHRHMARFQFAAINASPGHEDRNIRAFQHVAGHTAQDQLPQPRPRISAHG